MPEWVVSRMPYHNGDTETARCERIDARCEALKAWEGVDLRIAGDASDELERYYKPAARALMRAIKKCDSAPIFAPAIKPPPGVPASDLLDTSAFIEAMQSHA